MKLVGLMLGAALVAWLGIYAAADARLRADAGLAMIGPLFIASVTWLWMERGYRREPAAFTSRMTAAFGIKVLFFGLYIPAVLLLTPVRSVPFAASFTAAFVTFHAMEAFFLHRLLQGGGASGS
jgi:hypothetical protein